MSSQEEAPAADAVILAETKPIDKVTGTKNRVLGKRKRRAKKNLGKVEPLKKNMKRKL